jgi:hypothetical protein
LLLFKMFFTSSVVYPQKLSKMSILWRFRTASGHFWQTWLIQSSTRAWSIQPRFFGLDDRTFYIHLWQCLPFQDDGGNFPLSAIMHNITIHCCFSLPPVLTATFLSPFLCTVVSRGISKYTWVWSVLPICETV